MLNKVQADRKILMLCHDMSHHTSSIRSNIRRFREGKITIEELDLSVTESCQAINHFADNMYDLYKQKPHLKDE